MRTFERKFETVLPVLSFLVWISAQLTASLQLEQYRNRCDYGWADGWTWLKQNLNLNQCCFPTHIKVEFLSFTIPLNRITNASYILVIRNCLSQCSYVKGPCLKRSISVHSPSQALPTKIEYRFQFKEAPNVLKKVQNYVMYLYATYFNSVFLLQKHKFVIRVSQ